MHSYQPKMLGQLSLTGWKYIFCPNFTKCHANVHNLFSYLIQDSISYLVALSSISCMQQVLINSFFIFILLQIFSNFPCCGILDTPIIYQCTFNFQIHVFKVSLTLISHFGVCFSFNCFLLCGHSLCFFSLLTSLRLSMAESKISLGKCHLALENMWVVFKYLLTLISNIIAQW